MKGFLLAIVVVSTFVVTLYFSGLIIESSPIHIYGTEVIKVIKECEQNLPRNQNCVAVITAKPEGD